MKELELACEQFRTLLSEQLERVAKMNDEKVDYSAKDVITIGIVAGDGIGPIIMDQAVRVLHKLLDDKIAAGKICIKTIEGLTIENRLRLGKPVPEDVLAQIKSCDVLLKGPTTTPMGGKMESANVTLRRELDLYANVRPVCIPEEGIDWVFYRENTEGEYVLGSRGVELPGMAVDFKVTTDAGTRRIARAAFEYARQNGKNRVSIVTKANIMKKTDGKFTAICHEVAENYPGITADDWYIDIMTANLVNPAIRNQFQVFVLPNLYGDIITDEAAQIQGGVGTAGSANIGDRYAMFEAIHGSAPRMLEEGLGDYANPASILKAEAMLLRHICCAEEAQKLEAALAACKTVVTGDANGATCQSYADSLMELL
ncbi:MAG: isocitrate/isopropylmalate dehydrogenase family protein [Oscillospiraceae bacterium]|nr:isocitrate/isopropylmalate dehydrogenase family protein [Oscillospiraceae bacterium]